MGRILGVGLWALSGCTPAGELWEPDLDKLLRTEKAQALAAAKFGTGGGTLEITEGDYAGTMLEIPPGALGRTAVVSLYPATRVDQDLGYRAVGPALRLWGTTSEFKLDATLTLPFSADEVSAPAEASLTFLRQSDGQLASVAGAVFLQGRARAAIRELEDYSIALDLAVLGDTDDDEIEPPRCPVMSTGKSLQGAISASRIMALSTLPSTEQVLKARSFGADGCGFSNGWEVTWFSVIGAKQVTVEVWPSGPSQPVDAPIAKPACATDATAFKGSANSITLADDFFTRWGETPESLSISIRACNDPQPANPSRVRLEVPGTGSFVEYSANGEWLEQNF